MNKEEFLRALREKLNDLPWEDVERSLDYYGEIIDDRVEDGLREEEAVRALGSAGEIAAQILAESALAKPPREKTRPRRAMRAWEIALLILGFPIWLPLILAAMIVALALYIVVWSLVVAAYAAAVSLAAGAAAGLINAAVFAYGGGGAQGFLFLGVGCVLAGVVLLLFPLLGGMARGVWRMSRMAFLRAKGLFVGKEAAK